MSKDIKDYLHYYLGCEVMAQRHDTTEWHKGTMCEVTRGSNHGDWIDVRFEECVFVEGHHSMEKQMSNFHTFFIGYDNIKPLLRPLSDMTEDELKEIKLIMLEYNNLRFKCDEKDTIKYTNVFIYNEMDEDGAHRGTVFSSPENLPAKAVPWLTKHSFDIFDLIRPGLAIDKTKQ